ncbi:hypothetical protein [Streptomyces sp. 769]|uniref:hypothetical protein n=1 Tax=Streptomyces sp. 769 TaxID=1262452 RepID=UPI000581D016|nr:hypothetical protein [Streptomyces sp. 769]AJC54966.1 hypothetical protein GZL_02375 [Streptomyces sp. 769]
MKPMYHPAGTDDELRAAMKQLQVSRWIAMRDLLAETGSNWPLRSFRTQALGIMAAGSDVVEAWLAEEPDSYDAQVMLARVSVERALRSHRQRHGAAGSLEQRARGTVLAATRREWRDPVPWLCLLTLAQIDVQRGGCRPFRLWLLPQSPNVLTDVWTLAAQLDAMRASRTRPVAAAA